MSRSGSDKRLKTIPILVRVTEDQNHIVMSKASALNISRQDYLRNLGINKEIKPPNIDPQTGREILFELRKVGNNLNQLTRLAHQGYIDDCSIELDKIKNQFSKLLDIL